jgi:small conductance mechanosensitive channel
LVRMILNVKEMTMEGFERVIVEHMPQIFVGILILLVTFVAAKLIRMSLRRFLLGIAGASNMDRSISGVFYYVSLSIGILTGLNTMGVKMGPLIAGLGLGGFALGFALRDALSNLLAGILILLYRPFRAGDFIVVSGCEGSVSEINLRYTVLNSAGEAFMIPNSLIMTNPLRLKRQEGLKASSG